MFQHLGHFTFNNSVMAKQAILTLIRLTYFCINHGDQRLFFSIWNHNALVRFFCFIWIPMLLVNYWHLIILINKGRTLFSTTELSVWSWLSTYTHAVFSSARIFFRCISYVKCADDIRIRMTFGCHTNTEDTRMRRTYGLGWYNDGIRMRITYEHVWLTDVVYLYLYITWQYTLLCYRAMGVT